MSDTMEELIRAGLDRLTEQATVPAGLVGRARRGHRRRRLTFRAVLATGTAIAAAAATVIVVTAGGGVTPPAQTAAYVVNRVAKAVSAGQDIMYVHAQGIPQWQFVRGWSDGDRGRVDMFVVGGRLAEENMFRITHGRESGVVVDYSGRDWYRYLDQGTVPSMPANGCAPRGLILNLVQAREWPSYIRATLACGRITLAGQARIDGAETIRIVATARSEPGRRAAAAGRLTMYVSPSSYLPVRIDWLGTRVDLSWLPPTPANLAKLNVTIPPGFEQIYKPVLLQQP